MAELSRKKKFQELRDRLDEETTVTQVESVSTYIGPYGKITRQGAHAAKPIHSYQKEEAAPQPSAVAKSEVMSDLLGEVKQYNIDNGNRMDDDTQINILRTLESSSEQKRRNKHFVPMEEEEKMGSTMRIERGLKKEQPKAEAVLPKESKLTRINPINALPSFKKEEETKKTEENPIVLNQNDIRADYPAETDDLDILGFGQEKPAAKKEAMEQKEEPKPKKSHSFFKRKAKKEALPETNADNSSENTVVEQAEILDIETPQSETIVEEETIVPVKKSRKQDEEETQTGESSPAMNSQNIIIIVLIVLLLLSIALSFFILSRMNIF